MKYTYDRTWFLHHPRGSPLLYDTLYIPTNLSGQHWTGLVVDSLTHHISYYDSLRDINYSARVLHYIKNWLSDERSHLLQRQEMVSIQRAISLGNISSLTYAINPHPSPQQRNGFDCGIFYLSTTLYHIQGRLPTYEYHNIPLIRKQFLYALLTQSLPAPRVPLTHYDLPFSVPLHRASLPSLLFIPRPTLIHVNTPSVDTTTLDPTIPRLTLIHVNISVDTTTLDPTNDDYDYSFALLTGGDHTLSLLSPLPFYLLPSISVPHYPLLYPP